MMGGKYDKNKNVDRKTRKLWSYKLEIKSVFKIRVALKNKINSIKLTLYIYYNGNQSGIIHQNR
jgi:hypothetical protein